jgi:hypothetical protein
VARIQQQITKPENATAEAPDDAPRFQLSMQPAKFALCNLHMNMGKAEIWIRGSPKEQLDAEPTRTGTTREKGKQRFDRRATKLRNCLVAMCLCQRMAQVVDQRAWAWIYLALTVKNTLQTPQATDTQLKFQIHFMESSCPYSFHH